MDMSTYAAMLSSASNADTSLHFAEGMIPADLVSLLGCPSVNVTGSRKVKIVWGQCVFWG